MKKARVPLRTRLAVFILLGASIFLLAIYVYTGNTSKDAHDILIAFGVAITSVALLDAVFHLAGGNPIEQQIGDLSAEIERLSSNIDVIEKATKLGILEVHDCTANFGGKAEWLKVMKATNLSMDLMGRTLYEWVRAPELYNIVIDKIVRDNVSFRWLFMDEDNIYINHLEEDGRPIGETIKNKIRPVADRLRSIRERVPTALQGKFEVRTFKNHPLYCSVLRIDEKYLITPYMHSVASRNSPLLVIEGRSTPWGIAYEHEFDLVWAASDPLFS